MKLKLRRNFGENDDALELDDGGHYLTTQAGGHRSYKSRLNFWGQGETRIEEAGWWAIYAGAEKRDPNTDEEIPHLFLLGTKSDETRVSRLNDIPVNTT